MDNGHPARVRARAWDEESETYTVTLVCAECGTTVVVEQVEPGDWLSQLGALATFEKKAV